MKPGSAASLRWRSRIVKDAVRPDDSRGAVQEDYGLSPDSDKGKGNRFLSFFFPSFSSSSSKASSSMLWWSRFSWTLAALAFFVSLYALEFDRTWTTAVTSSLNVFLSATLVYTVRRLTLLGSVRRQVQYSRQRAQQMAVQNERLYRTLGRLDKDQLRLEAVRRELHKLVGETKGSQNNTHDMHDSTMQSSAKRLIRAAQRWRVVQAQLHQALTHQVQACVVQALLTTDRDANFVLSPSEWERLLVRLQHLPGVTVDERALRLLWDREEEKSLAAALRLLRRLTDEAHESANASPRTPKATGAGKTPQSHSHGSKRSNRSAATTNAAAPLLQLDARALCEASAAHEKDLMTFV